MKYVSSSHACTCIHYCSVAISGHDWSRHPKFLAWLKEIGWKPLISQSSSFLRCVTLDLKSKGHLATLSQWWWWWNNKGSTFAATGRKQNSFFSHPNLPCAVCAMPNPKWGGCESDSIAFRYHSSQKLELAVAPLYFMLFLRYPHGLLINFLTTATEKILHEQNQFLT